MFFVAKLLTIVICEQEHEDKENETEKKFMED